MSDYGSDGFELLEQVVPDGLLRSGQAMLERWADSLIAAWRDEGLLAEPYVEVDFAHRLHEAWLHAGRPHFRRRPNRHLINPTMYDFLRSPALLGVAERLLGTPELSVHGIFNGRPQFPGVPEMHTPWHQDSQYWSLDYGEPEPDVERRTHVVTLWVPLQDVDTASGCLQVMSARDTGSRALEVRAYDYERTGYLGLTAADIDRHPHRPVPMKRGDLLAFNQRTPHASCENGSGHIRWSIDVRYEATARTTVIGRKYGFVAQSKLAPASVTPLTEWLAKQEP